MDEVSRKKLSQLKANNKVPNATLFVGFLKNKLDFLIEAASILSAGQSVSVALGNALILGEEASDTSIKVEEVRALIKNLSLQNWSKEKARFVLIPYAENLTDQSSNALLKSIEEPPVGTHFLLMAPSRKSVLKTILSRSFSLVLKDAKQEPLDLKEENFFYKSIFLKEEDVILNKSRAEVLLHWETFKKITKDEFFNKAYSGELDRSAWFELFNFIEDLDRNFGSHTDIKWINAKLGRESFSV